MLELIIAIASGSIFTCFINSMNEMSSSQYLIKILIYVGLIYWGLKKVGHFNFKKPWMWVFSLFLSFLTIVGKSYVATGKVAVNPLYLAVLGLSWYILIYIFSNIKFKTKRSNSVVQKLDKNWFRIGLLLLVYGFFWYIAYPGILHPDSMMAIYEGVHQEVSFHYSPIYIVLITLVYVIFGAEKGTAVLCCLTFIIFSLLVNRLIKLIDDPTKRLIATCFFAFNPIIFLWASSASKDVIFSICLVLLCSESYIKITKGMKNYYRHFIEYALICCLLRNNAVYVFIAWAIVMLIFERKLMFKQAGCLFFVVFIFFLYQNIGINQLKLKTDDIQEIFSVPLHQMHGVYYNEPDYFTEKEKTLIKEHFDNFYWQYYSPQIADSSKEGFRRIDDGLIKLYIKAGIDNPEQYLNSFVSLTYNSFYSDAVKNTYNEKQSCLFEHDRANSDPSICENITSEKDLFIYNSNAEYIGMDVKFPKINHFMKEFCIKINYENIPVISKIFSISSYTIIYLLVICKNLNKKNYRFVMAFLPLGLFWGTMLLGPCTLYRYYLSFVYALPILLMIDDSERQFYSF